MAQGLYIVTAEPRSGKSLVALGLMELLSAGGRRTGYFRPVISGSPDEDPSLRLIASHYGLTAEYDRMFGCSYETAREMIASGRQDELFGLILDRYGEIEDRCDVVLCSGSDYTGVSAALELEFNLEVANNLGCSVVPVVNGRGKTVTQIATAAHAFLDALRDHGCVVLAAFVNRVPEGLAGPVKDLVAKAMPAGGPVYVVSEHPVLDTPTVGQVVAALDPECLSCDPEGLEREISDYKVAAMELPHFLERLGPRSLVVVPGDRSDIILGSLLANASDNHPQIAALLLTGGLRPTEQVRRLVDGLKTFPVPVLAVAGDTFETALALHAMETAILPENTRQVAAALGAVEESVDRDELEPLLIAGRRARVTPLMFEHGLLHRAKQERKRIVLPEGTDGRVLQAAEILRLRDIVDLTLLGDPGEIRKLAAAAGYALQGVEIVDPLRSGLRDRFTATYFELRRHKGISEQYAHDALADVNYFGTMMVHHGLVDGMVSGAAHTTQHTIRPALEIIRTRPGCSVVSSVFFMCLPDRVLVYGDCAINPNPTDVQLADIAVSSADTARAFGVEPLVALLSYSTGSSGKGEDVDRVRRATELARARRPDLKIEGPIQYDAAVDPGVAASKLSGSEVAGRATVLIFPDLNTGNNTYKAVQRSAGAVAVGPVLQGLNKPVNDLSRGCTATDIVNTVAITAIQAQQGAAEGA